MRFDQILFLSTKLTRIESGQSMQLGYITFFDVLGQQLDLQALFFN